MEAQESAAPRGAGGGPGGAGGGLVLHHGLDCGVVGAVVARVEVAVQDGHLGEDVRGDEAKNGPEEGEEPGEGGCIISLH